MLEQIQFSVWYILKMYLRNKLLITVVYRLINISLEAGCVGINHLGQASERQTVVNKPIYDDILF